MLASRFQYVELASKQGLDICLLQNCIALPSQVQLANIAKARVGRITIHNLNILS